MALIGNEVPTGTLYSQVYMATHEGENYLPFMKRSFISFSYGGKHIEEYNLIATTKGDRMEKLGYTGFEDVTTNYTKLDGQLYWGTRFTLKNLELNLATDGMDLRQLDDFLYWFSPGLARELILAEHPNRAILARVSEPPQLHLLPFETKVQVKIGESSYTTSTTLYRGEIDLQFVMDDPYWYSKENILGKVKNGVFIDKWTDANNNEVFVMDSPDALKILYEDGIPLGSLIQNNMLLGNGAFAIMEERTISRIWSIPNDADIVWSGGSWGSGEPSGQGARIEPITPTLEYGIVAGAIVNNDGNGINSLAKHASENDKNVGYFYYSGTAPSPTIINFSITLLGVGSNGYITVPYNSHTNIHYNTFTIECQDKLELLFTTPNILTSFNTVIEIFNAKVNSNYSWEDIRASIRDEVRHKYAREWAIKIVDTMIENLAARNNSTKNIMKEAMTYFLRQKDSNNNDPYYPMIFTFNSETGEATGKFSYRTVTLGKVENNAWSSYGNISEEVKENVGDMLRSNYLIIRERNYPNQNGSIVAWTKDNKAHSHRIYHDVNVPLKDVSIIYRNMYL